MKKPIIFLLTILIIFSFSACFVKRYNPPPKIPETPADEFEYIYDETERGIIIIKYTGNSLNVRIPAKIDGEPVAAIGEGAFRGGGIVSAYIPNTVKNIGSGAFQNCKDLTEIVIPKNVGILNNNVFSGCAGLTKVTIPEGVTVIDNGVFGGCSGLTAITIPENVTSVGDRVFNGCIGLTEIIFPKNVTSIGDRVFSGCSALTKVTIPESVASIGVGVFNGCTALTEMTVNGEMKIGGLLFFGVSVWRILDIEDDRALVLSEEVMLKQAYHSHNVPITWEFCDLRNYLNDRFYNDNFSTDEKIRIAETKIVNNDNSQYGTSGGSDTTDKIFILSIEEANQYFSGNKTRIAVDSAGTASWYWLRSPGYETNYAAFVPNDGFINPYGNIIVNIGGGVRPALWLNTE